MGIFHMKKITILKEKSKNLIDKDVYFLKNPVFYALLFFLSVGLSLLKFPIGDIAQAGLLLLAIYTVSFTREQLLEWRRKEIIKHCDVALRLAKEINNDVNVVISQSVASESKMIFVWFESHEDRCLHELSNIYDIKEEMEVVYDHLSYMGKSNDVGVFLEMLDGVLKISKYVKSNNISGDLEGSYLQEYLTAKRNVSDNVAKLFSSGSLDKDFDITKYIKKIHKYAVR